MLICKFSDYYAFAFLSMNKCTLYYAVHDKTLKVSKPSDTYCIHSTNTGGRKLSGCDSSQTILPSFITQQILSELNLLAKLPKFFYQNASGLQCAKVFYYQTFVLYSTKV